MIFQSFRYWLADLISGGNLEMAHFQRIAMIETWDRLTKRTKLAEAQANEATHKAYQLQADLNEAREDRLLALADAGDWAATSQDLRDALRTIAAMRTPKANATVRRMARVAEEAVK